MVSGEQGYGEGGSEVLWIVDFVAVGNWAFRWVIGAPGGGVGFVDVGFGWWLGDGSWWRDGGADLDMVFQIYLELSAGVWFADDRMWLF